MQNTKRPTLYIDKETFSACDLKECGADVYGRHESTGVWCLCYAIDDEPVQIWILGEPCPYDILIALEDNYRVVAHNISFEWALWEFVLHKKYGWPKLKIENCDCTMVRSYAMSLPGSLDGSSKSLKLKHEKDAKANRIMLQLSQPRTDGSFYDPKDPANKEKFEILYNYCKQDVEVERAIDKVVLPLSPTEKQLWIIDHKINQRGISADLKSLKVALAIVEGEQLRLREELQKITDNQVATYNSHAQFKKWILSQGLTITSIDKEAVTKLLASPKTPSRVKDALLIRQEAAKSSTAKFASMINGACDDGKLRGLFQYHGANTGRWAGRRTQVQNLPRPSLKQNDIDSIFGFINEVEEESVWDIQQSMMT